MPRVNADPENQQLLRALAGRLYALRQVVGASQQDFCIKLGVDRGTYQTWEVGRNFPSIIAMRKLCDAYSVDFNWLFNGDYRLMPGDLAAALAAAIAGRRGP
jgi:transcriptional regulator with XRE-family HTH domain